MIVYFEGIDGVGKSTQILKCKEKFSDAICTCEPGGSELGKKLREILLTEKISSRAEILLFLADRAQHYASVLSKNKNKLILSDRGFVSGIAYAMANDENYDIKELIDLNRFALQNDFQAKFIFLKADENLIQKRLFLRQTNDIIEKRGIQYLLRVQNFIEIILKDLQFCYLELSADEEIDIINQKIQQFIKG